MMTNSPYSKIIPRTPDDEESVSIKESKYISDNLDPCNNYWTPREIIDQFRIVNEEEFYYNDFPIRLLRNQQQKQMR